MDIQFIESNKEELWKLYCENGRQAVADYCGIRYNSAGHVLKHLGFYDRKEEHEEFVRRRVTSLNPFIEDTQLKYYLLGYILGDGCISKKNNKFVLSIASKDSEHLLKLAKPFGVTTLRGPYKGCWEFTINDYETVTWLMEFGIKPRKSKNGNNPLNIPVEFKESFVCGLLDSDGCIRTGNRGRSLKAEWWGHESYMDWVQSLIPNSKKYVRKYDGLVCVSLQRQSDVESYLNEMYSKTPLRMERKYKRFIEHDFTR